MSSSESDNVQKTLQKPDVHQDWIQSYRTPENDRFYEIAFDYIAQVLNAPQGSVILDAGCGSCAHSIRLARRGFSVCAVDYSKNILETAGINLRSKNFVENIKLQQENILSLSFEDNTFDYILCWGVLMHIPEVSQAIAELDRVLKKGGVAVISEANMYSIQAMTLRGIKTILGKEKAVLNRNEKGIEYWEKTSAGDLVTRQTNIMWLKKKFINNGFEIKKHISGQFTELYTRLSFPFLRKQIHGFNNIWFKYLKIPYFSFGNILIVRKNY